MSACQYVRDYYGVPAEIGRRVTVSGKPGIIAADRGHYIGVNFDADKPGVIFNVHPTSEVEYGAMGKLRRLTRSQRRYVEYLDVADLYDGFADYLRSRRIVRAAASLASDKEKAAEFYIKASGKTAHASDCATSRAPAQIPGPCDCNEEEK